MNLRQLTFVVGAALAVGGTAMAEVGQSGPAASAAQVAQSAPGAPAVTPPPPPPPNGAVATPGTLIGPATSAPTAGPTAGSIAAPTATPAPGRRGRRDATPQPGASPSDTPEPPQFSTMDGVWEVQLQPLLTGRTVYSHLYITQKGDDLSGSWVRAGSDKLAFTGTFDGRLFKLTAKDAKQTLTLTGYAENFSDMVGLLTNGDPADKGTPFTAAHRKKERLNV